MGQPSNKKPRMTILYALSTPFDVDDSTPTEYQSLSPVELGDLICVANEMWHRVDLIQMLPSGVLELTLAQSGDSPSEAQERPMTKLPL